VHCRNCGDELDPRRVELGYDYCTRLVCQKRHMRRVRLARVGVNKAADQFVRADSVLPPDPGPRDREAIRDRDLGDDADPANGGNGADRGDDADRGNCGIGGDGIDESDRRASPTPRRPSPTGPPPPTAAERMRAAGAALDARLERIYQRFCASEISATEMDRERNALIDDYNARLLTKGVRYRHLLRRRF
jgi:hypothetical protein